MDASVIDARLLEETLHEANAIEANVATGHHAVDFLLWGQDLNGTGPGAGERPWTDYAAGDACTGGHCDRRAEYLKAATDRLISDLEWITAQWAGGGAARENLMSDPDTGIVAIFTGMGSLRIRRRSATPFAAPSAGNAAPAKDAVPRQVRDVARRHSDSRVRALA